MFLSHFHLATISVLAVLCSHVIADTRNWNPQGDGCVDPKGFLSCYQDNSDTGVGCVQLCNQTATVDTGTYDNCILGCNGHWLASNIGCWIQSCWNEVYSCEYQMTAIDYFDGTDLVQSGVIPFYPPPDDASAGACSCNLGYVYGNETFINMNNACTDVAGSGDFNALYTCECCEFGFPVSNILNVCPKSDLTLLNFADKLASIQKLLSQSTDNCAILDNSPSTCVTEWNYPWYGNTTYNPLNLPEGEPGTEPLSNLPGNAFTDFGAPAYTLSLFPAYSSVITPAPFSANAGVDTQTLNAASADITATGSAGATASVTGKASGTASGTAASTGKSSTGTSGGAGAAQTSTKSGAVRKFMAGNAIWAGCVVWVVAIALP